MIIQLAPRIARNGTPIIYREEEPSTYTPPEDEQTFENLPSFDPADPMAESYEEAYRRIMMRYGTLEKLCFKVANARVPSFIGSGPPGLGKSFTMDREIAKTGRHRHDGLEPLEDATNWYDHISGGCMAPGLYHSLWNMRNGGILLLDDCDGVFYDDEAINLLKIATDSSKQRLLSWRKKAAWLDQYLIERTFDFKGHIAFLTNIDFEQVIKKTNKDTEHFKALIDRARYLCLTIRTQRDFMIRIRQVAIEEKMLERDHGLNLEDAEALLQYVEQNKYRFYNLSLRLVGQIADTMREDPLDWKDEIESVKMKTEN